MIINRNILSKLKEWKNRSDRKPLIIRGARQVGKTTVVTEFARQYKYRIFLNLEKTKDKAYFTNEMDAKSILESLFLYNKIDLLEMNNTLVFIDEIQESPNAIQILRYFYEEFPDLNVIAAGSLLEFAIKKVKSFPVGRIEYLYIHPINFEEFIAIKNDKLLEHLCNVPINPIAHHILMEQFNIYAIIGGMPEVVKEYIKNDSFTSLPRIYESIWSTYKNDVEKYTSSSTAKNVIKHIMNTAHLFLDKRVKFQNFGNSNYRSREVGEAMRNLNDARIIQLIYPTVNVEFPIVADLKKSPRLQFLDTGLVNHALNIQSEMIGLKDLSNSYKGAIIPHLITQELISLNSEKDNKPNFWVREKTQSSSEVDLVISYKNRLIPIEIKSGATGSLKSLHQFIDRTNHHYAIRMYAGDFKIEKTKTPNKTPYFLMNLPYYLGTKIEKYIEYFMKRT
jgi:predicted AAA+ superfamily ATPase